MGSEALCYCSFRYATAPVRISQELPVVTRDLYCSTCLADVRAEMTKKLGYAGGYLAMSRVALRCYSAGVAETCNAGDANIVSPHRHIPKLSSKYASDSECTCTLSC